ncbi:MAG: lactate utilization protein [bacterium]
MKDWTTLPKQSIIDNSVKNLIDHGFDTEVVETKEDALAAILSYIPEGSEIMTGSSTTLDQIGFTNYLTTNTTKFNNLGASVWAENDADKRNVLRRKSETADYFLSSVNAVTEDGKLVAVDLSGSRVGAFAFSAGHLVLVVSTFKIVKDLNLAMERIQEYVFPLENERAKKAYGANSGFGKWVILEREIQKGRIHVVLVNEILGF